MKAKYQVLLTLLVALVFFAVSCSEDDNGTTQSNPLAGDCIGCHTDDAKLQATAEPDTSEAPENPGEG